MGSIAAVAAVVSAVTAVAGAGIAYKSSEDQKDAQEEYNRMLEKEAIRQYGELDKAESDAIYESHAESMQAQRDYLQARSNIELQSAVTGTYGNSINIAIQDLNTGLGGRMADITYKRDSQLDAIDQTAERIQTSPSMNADTSIKMPSYYAAFSSGLNTLSSTNRTLTDVGNAYSQVKPATKS